MGEVITPVINKKFSKINLLLSRIINGFEIKSIHEFRTEVKKLRAFLRLLNVEINDDSLKITKQMSLFYHYAGTIRNLQLQAKNVESCRKNSAHGVIKIYIEYLEKMIEKWKVNAIDFSYSKNNFCDDQKKLNKRLPAKLRKASIKKFTSNKMKEFLFLAKELPGEETLHAIRKLLKDILYNWKFVRAYETLLPSYFSKKEKIKSFTELLGIFLDKHTAINLLETYCRDSEENGSFSQPDISALQEIESVWKKEKQDLSREIYSGWFCEKFDLCTPGS